MPVGAGFIIRAVSLRTFEALDAEPGLASDVRVAIHSRMVMRFMPLSYGGMGGRRGIDRRTTFKIDEGQKQTGRIC